MVDDDEFSLGGCSRTFMSLFSHCEDLENSVFLWIGDEEYYWQGRDPKDSFLKPEEDRIFSDD